MTERRTQFRAVFLAAVMALSLVAMGAAAIGASTAQAEETVTITVDAELEAEPGETTTIDFWVSEEESGEVLDIASYEVGPEETETGEVTLTADFANENLTAGDTLPVSAVVSDGNMNFLNPAPDFSVDDVQPGEEYDLTGSFLFELGSPDALEITEYQVSETTIGVGDSVGVQTTVENQGDEAGSMDVPLVVDGETVSVENVDVLPGETVTVEFDWTFDAAGEYEVTVGDLEPTTVTVGDGDEHSLDDYANEDGIIEMDGVRDAISDWRTGTIGSDLLRDAIDAWRTGDPVE